jgi:hypothetical protein
VAAAALAMWVMATAMAAVMTEAMAMAAEMAARAMAFHEVGFLPHRHDNQPAC